MALFSEEQNGVNVGTSSNGTDAVTCAICGQLVRRFESGNILFGCNACRPGGYWVTRMCAAHFERMPLDEAQKDVLRALVAKGLGSEDDPIDHHVVEYL